MNTLKRFAAILAITFLASACTTFESGQHYLCPNIITDSAYQRSLERTNGPFYVPLNEVWERCRSRMSSGCTILEPDNRATVYIADSLTDTDDITFHEICHVHRLFAVGIPFEQELQHVGWIRSTR